MRLSFISLFVLLLMSFSSSSRISGQGAKGISAKEAKAAIVAYGANIDSFPYYRCRFRILKGQAKSLEDAIRGKYFNSRFYDSRQIVDGDKELYEGFAPPPDANQAQEVPNKKGVFIVPLFGSQQRYLSDGKLTMGYGLNSINLHRNLRAPTSATPMQMFFLGHRALRGPNYLLKQTDTYDFSVVGLEEILGRPCLTVRFDRRKAPGPAADRKLAKVFSFDPSRGHLPIRMQLVINGKPESQVFVTQVRECSNKRWFPERVIDVVPMENGQFEVTEMLLLELNADERPKADEFFFLIPAGTSVLEFGGDLKKFFRLKQEEKVRIEDIPTLFKMLERVKVDPRMNTTLSEHRPAQWGRWVLAGTGVALALAGGIVILRRRNARQVAA